LEQCKPVYVKLPGWKSDTRGITKFEDLPENARHYVEFLEKEVGCPFKLISNGPRRDEIIYR
ncbi:MAG: adenylosuccinate synthetase, partial [Christensenellales bacterium]